MYYVSRGGGVEGPFPLDAIVAGLRDGSLAMATLCAQGTQAWQPATAFPEIAQAMAAGQASYPAVPAAQAAYGQPTRGQPPAAHAQPQPDYASAAQAPAGMAPHKKGPPILALFGALALIALLVGGAAVAYRLSGGVRLAKWVPKATTAYVEVPSVKGSMLSLSTMKSVDPEKANAKKKAEEVIAGVAAAFEIPKEDASDLVMGIDSVAIASKDSEKVAVLVKFSSRSTAEKLFKSRRFTPRGKLGEKGAAYTLMRGPRPAPVTKELASVTHDALASASLDDEHAKLVLFDNGLVAVGSDVMVGLIGDVVEGKSESLEKSEAFAKAKKDIDSRADVVLFVDTHLLDGDLPSEIRNLASSYLHDRDPVSATLKVTKAGVVIDGHARLTGAAVPPAALVPPAPALKYPRKLPKDTLAFLAYSTKTSMKGADARAAILKHSQLADPKAARRIEEDLKELEKNAGFGVDQVFDAMGDEAAWAIVLEERFKYDPKDGLGEELAKGAILFVQAIKDEALAKRMLATLRSRLEETLGGLAKVRSTPNGFEIDPETEDALPVPNVRVELVDKQLVVALAAPQMLQSCLASLREGKLTLKDDAAMERSLDAMPSHAHSYLWFDTGRFTDAMLTASPRAKEKAIAAGIPLDNVILRGPSRLTSGMALRYRAKDDGWGVDVGTVNVPGLAVLGALGYLDPPLERKRGALGVDTDTPDAPKTIPPPVLPTATGKATVAAPVLPPPVAPPAKPSATATVAPPAKPSATATVAPPVKPSATATAPAKPR